MPTKLDFAVVAAVLTGLVVVENSHRIELVAPALAAPEVKVVACTSADERTAASQFMAYGGGYGSAARLAELAAEAAKPNCAE
jgi:hypothetical protein